MSPDADRIAVPTNGRGPHPAATVATAPVAPADPVAQPGVPSDEDLATAFSPKQLAIGLGIIASLVLLIAGRARRRRPGG